MNKTINEATDLMIKLNSFVEKNKINCEVVIAPPFLYLNKATEIFCTKKIKISAQNMSEYSDGAYTGEISAKMLQSMHVDYVILGHSERRHHFYENDELLKNKIKIAIKYNITPIYCCGELFSEREKGNKFEVNKKQIKKALFGLNHEDINKVIIAYEPVWAIGTGNTASPKQIQEIHEFIRTLIEKRYSRKIANSISILYGGSINAKNIKEIFLQEDVDGGLIGKASLKEEEFTQILKSFK